MITYVIGDATNPTYGEADAIKIIPHVCNNIGGWGRGFVLALSKVSPTPERMYRGWHERGNWLLCPFELGQIQLASISLDTWVINMIAQDDIVWKDGVPPIRYDALENCLVKLNGILSPAPDLEEWLQYKEGTKFEIHAPRFGAGLAGGDWNKIEEIIKRTITVPVYIYDLPENA